MYPDQLDVIRIVGEKRAKEIWGDVALAHDFLLFAHRTCHYHGKHYPMLTTELRQTTEEHIGHAISDDAFFAALKMLGYMSRRNEWIKFPPLEKLNEYREQWDETRAAQEAAIAEAKAREHV
jgi:hypothetical protein